MKNQYVVGKKLNNGAFGQLRLGRDLHAKDHHSKKEDEDDGDEENLSGSGLVAIKLEPANSKIPMLSLEFRFYKMLSPHRGLPQVSYL